MDDMIRNGKAIRQARVAKNMTQEQLAQDLFVSKQAVCQWENGQTSPNFESVKRIRKVLGVDLTREETQRTVSKVDITELYQITSRNELKENVEKILDALDLDTEFGKTVRKLVRLTLYTVLAYEIYIRGGDYSEEYPLSWDVIGYDIDMINDDRNYSLFRGTKKGLERELQPIREKIDWLAFQIGAELFEDFDEDGYRYGYIQQVGNLGEKSGHDFLKIFPLLENAIYTLYKSALLDVSDLLNPVDVTQEGMAPF